MATNFRRLGAAVSLAALAFVATFLAPAPVQAEPPKTALEWFNLIHRRNADIYGVRMESSWQQLEEGKLVDEWDQILETDDLGGIRIQELGRTQRGAKGDDTVAVTDEVYAFNGSEYRELSRMWAVSPTDILTKSRKVALMAAQPRMVAGSIEGEPGRTSGLNRSTTPLAMADHWFLTCLSNTLSEGIDLQVVQVAGQSGRWEILVDSADDTFGHKCRAIVDDNRDLRVTELDVWGAGRWAARYEMQYGLTKGRWTTASGVRRTYASKRNRDSGSIARRRRVSPPTMVEYELRFRVERSGVSTHPQDQVSLPHFPSGAQVIDSRSNAQYTVGLDHIVDSDVARLVELGKQRLGEPVFAFQARPMRIRTMWLLAGILLAMTAFNADRISGIRTRFGNRRNELGSQQRSFVSPEDDQKE